MAVNPYDRSSERGVLLNLRTLEMLEVAEMHWLRSFAPIPLSQGSYSTSVGQSAGTHDGGGALDVRVRDMTGSQKDAVVWALRKIGFAAWHRLPSQGDWPEHIHAIAIGDRELSPAAKQQVVDYRNGLNGLKNKGPDDGPDIPIIEYRQDIDLSYYGPEKWDDADWKLFWAWVHGSNSRYENLVQGGKAEARDIIEYAHKNATEGEAEAKAAKIAAVSADEKLTQVLALLVPSPPPTP